MNKLQSERIGRIEKVKAVIRQIKKNGKEINQFEFVMEIMKRMRVSAFIAKEYIKQAKYELKIK